MQETSTQDKILIQYFKNISNISYEEREELLKGLMDRNNWSMRQLSNYTKIPLTTLHGWITRREKIRKNKRMKISEDILSISQENTFLRNSMINLEKIKSINSDIGYEILDRILIQVMRLKEK